MKNFRHCRGRSSSCLAAATSSSRGRTPRTQLAGSASSRKIARMLVPGHDHAADYLTGRFFPQFAARSCPVATRGGICARTAAGSATPMAKIDRRSLGRHAIPCPPLDAQRDTGSPGTATVKAATRSDVPSSRDWIRSARRLCADIFGAHVMAQFNEANTVRDFVRDLVDSVDVQFVPGSALPRTTSEVLLEARSRMRCPAQSGDRGRPEAGRRGDLPVAGDHPVGAEHAQPGRGQRGVHGLADRAEVDAVRPGRRARPRSG